VFNSAMSDPNYPGLSIGMALKQSIGCRRNIFIDFKLSRFDVVHGVLR
jgi:hypothetical protein